MKIRKSFSAAIIAITLSAGIVAVSSPAQAQFGGLGKLLEDIAAPTLGSLIGGKKPISTNIKDATYGDPSKDGFTPPMAAQPLTSLRRTKNGGFKLAAGYYEMQAQSYCLHAGTHGPGGGDGYLYAPVLGSADDEVIAILQNSVDHPEIDQRKIQLLLWAIVSKAKFEDLNNDLKIVAAQLLSRRQLASLNRNALSVLSSREFSSIIGGTPPALRRVLSAERDIRRMVSRPNLVYSDIEAAAVLAGAVPMGEGSVQTPSGRWSLYPDGYFIRYIPSGYRRTLIQIWVESGSRGVGESFDPAEQIAVPGNTSRQRLAQSGRPSLS